MRELAYQPLAIDFLRRVPKGILALDMRMGKSRCALMAAEAPVLIICPVPVKIHWAREVAKWRPEWEDDIQIIDSKSERPGRAAVTIVPYSIFNHFVDKGMLQRPKYLIIDEVHYCKNPRAKRTKAAMKLLRSVKRAAMLSGTPMPNRPIELYPLLKELKIVKNKHEFGMEYCAGWMSPWGWDFTGASNLERLAELLKPVMFRRSMADLKDELPPILPPVIIELDLPLDEREKEFDAGEIARSPHAFAFEAISDIMHLSGLRKVPLAVEYIRDLLENEKKIIVWAHHRDVIEAIRLAFDDVQPLVIHGGTKDRQSIIDDFNTKPGHRILVGNIKAMGVGVEITGASYNVFVEAPWVPGDLRQAIARPWGPNQSKPVRTDILTIYQSIDAHILHSIIRKERWIETVIKETNHMSKVDELIVAVIEERAMALDMNVAEYLAKLNLHTGELDPDDYEEPEGDVSEAAGVVEVTLEDVRQGLAKVMRSEGADKVRGILKKFKASKVSDIAQGDYLAVLELIDE